MNLIDRRSPSAFLGLPLPRFVMVHMVARATPVCMYEKSHLADRDPVLYHQGTGGSAPMQWLRGKKTYILAAAALLAILARFADGQLDAGSALNEVLIVIGLVTARAGAQRDDAAKP